MKYISAIAVHNIIIQIYFTYSIFYIEMSTENKILDTIDENRDACNKEFKNYKTPTSNIKECFREYSLEDKVEALKNILVHNEKHARGFITPQINKMCSNKKIIGVKECLQPDEQTSFQTIISELKNTVMNSYWNKQVGKTRYQISNLPVGMNPLEVTFGKTNFGETMADVLKEKVKEKDISEQKIVEIYKKSHNSYLPAEQIKRHYEKPFDENICFGESRNINNEGARLKKLLTWINPNPDTIVDSNLADFKERSHSYVGKVKNLKNAYIYMNMVHGRISRKREISDTSNVLSDCPINNEVIVQKNYLQYINSLRQKLKKHIPETSFLDIYEDLLSLDKDYTNILPEDKVYSILARYKILINKTFLVPLLNLLQIRKEKDVKYRELLNLLCWKYDFPTLPKTGKIPLECQYYSTTYNNTIGNVGKIDTAYIPAAGISYKNLDKTTAYSLIFPNIFTKYGLSQTELSKLRNKEEIQSIFESIGIKFSNDSFDLLWEEGIKKNGTDNVSVETFINLLNQYDHLINDKNN